MTNKTKIIILIFVIVLGVAAFTVWDNQRNQNSDKTAEEIQKEIERLEKLIKEVEEDNKKAESGEVACVLVYDPVCGKDGRTYSNDCFASAAGVEISYEGECK